MESMMSKPKSALALKIKAWVCAFICLDYKSFYKSLWVGPWLIVWTNPKEVANDSFNITTAWYDWRYWRDMF